MNDWKESALAIALVVVGVALAAFLAYGKYVMYDRDIRCLVAECRIQK